MLDALWIDIRQSLRGLHRSPGFSSSCDCNCRTRRSPRITAIFSSALARSCCAPSRCRIRIGSSRSRPATHQTHTARLHLCPIRSRHFGRINDRSRRCRMCTRHVLTRVSTHVAPRSTPAWKASRQSIFALVGARLAAGRFLTDVDNAPRRRRHAGGCHPPIDSGKGSSAAIRVLSARCSTLWHAGHDCRCHRTGVLRTAG